MSLLPVSLGTISDVIPSNVIVPPIDYTSRDYASLVNDMLNLIPSYLPEWTDRSPGDFGIVMLELFAYMGDVLNYYSDRIANEAFIATAQQRQSVINLANLLDYTPHSNVSATCTLQFYIQSPSPVPVLVPAHTQVSTILSGNQSVTFETMMDLWIFGDQVTTPKSVVSSGQPHQTIALNDPTQPYPTYNFNGGVNQTCSVVPVGGTATTWTYAAGNTFVGQANTATVYTIVNGNTMMFGDGVTGGAIPPQGAAINITFQPASPSQYNGQVAAMAGTSNLGEGIGISDGTPNQQYTLFNTPVVDGSITVYVDEGNGPIPWAYCQRIVDAFSSQGAYTISIDANGVVTVQFGDNISGRIPAVGAFITADYMVGGGASSNVAAGSLTALMSGPPNVISVSNPQAAAGGADAETTDHIRIHAPLSISAINRAVTLDDYAALVLNLASIAKASAMSTAYNAVNIYIHPAGNFMMTSPTDTNGQSTLVNRVNALLPTITNSAYTGYMDDKKMVGTSVVILPPQYNNGGVLSTGYVPCNVTATVQVLPQYHQQEVESGVMAAIQNLFLFAVVDFGSRVSLSSVYHACMNVEGVDYVIVNLMARNEASQVAAPADILCAPYEIPTAYQINVNGQGGIPY